MHCADNWPHSAVFEYEIKSGDLNEKVAFLKSEKKRLDRTVRQMEVNTKDLMAERDTMSKKHSEDVNKFTLESQIDSRSIWNANVSTFFPILQKVSIFTAITMVKVFKIACGTFREKILFLVTSKTVKEQKWAYEPLTRGSKIL